MQYRDEPTRIYKMHSGFRNIPNSYSLTDENVDETRGDEGADYVLPDGYTVAEDNLGRPQIFDPQGERCAIVEHSSGRPQLVSSLHSARPVLDLA